MRKTWANTTSDTVSKVLRRHRGDVLIVVFMSVLMMIGLVVIYSISPALTAKINAAGNTLDQNHFMYRQVAYLLAGVGAFCLASFVPLEWWRKHQMGLLIGAIGLCMVPIIFASTGIALCTNGACRWINLGFVTLQPAEALKFTLVIFLAAFLARRIEQNKLQDVQETLIPLAVLLAVSAIIVVGLQKDLGTGLALFGIVASMLYVGGLQRKYFALALAAIGAVGLVFVVLSPHRIERIVTFMNASDNKDSTGYHINQALIAVGSGGWFGKGLGRSVQAFGYLPEAANDSIFAIVAEKFGFVGTVIILVIFAFLFLRLLRIMEQAGTVYHRLLMAGIFGWVFTHAIVNIGAMIGIFPLTGVTLPFLSFGGTSLLFIMLALGVAFQISRYTTHQKNSTDEGGGTYEDRRGRRGLRRARYASTGRS